MDQGLTVTVLFNPTFWIAAILLATVLWPGTDDAARRCRVVIEAATRPMVLAAIAGLVFVNVGGRAVLGHAVPGDFVQEVVAARTFAEDGTLYSADVNADVRDWLEAEPPSLWTGLPAPLIDRLHARQQVGRNRLVAQAHPPTLLLAVAPLVWWAGAHWTFWLLTAATAIAVALATRTLLAVMWPGASRPERRLILLVLLGWQPVLSAIRDGQVSVLIGCLLVAGWAGMRRERSSSRSGVAIGLAAALKLYPTLLVVHLALRRRAALAAAVATIVAAGLVVSLTAGPRTWVEYGRAAPTIATAFLGDPHNLALTARLAGLISPEWLTNAYWCTATIMVLATLGVTLRHDRSAADPLRLDVEYALFLSLAFLLSPVAWPHYIFMLVQPLAVVLGAAIGTNRRTLVAVWAAAVLVLSLPGDVLPPLWSVLPDRRLALAISPGVVVLLLWAALLYLRYQPETLSVRGRRLAAATIS